MGLRIWKRNDSIGLGKAEGMTADAQTGMGWCLTGTTLEMGERAHQIARRLRVQYRGAEVPKDVIGTEIGHIQRLSAQEGTEAEIIGEKSMTSAAGEGSKTLELGLSLPALMVANETFMPGHQ